MADINNSMGYKMPSSLERMIGVGGLGAGLGGMIGQGLGQQNYMQAANPYLQQMQPGIDKYLSPYINAGAGAMGTLQDQYGKLLNDPNSILNKFGSGYQQSPGYQQNVNEATRASNNAAAAGGFIGSPQQQADLAKEIGGYANQDYNQYLNNVLGLYGQGLSGMGNIGQMGYGASQGAMNSLNDMLKSQAMLAYTNSANQSESAGGMGAGLGGLFGSAFGLSGLGKKIGGMFGGMFD